jgi:hypothetical protein
VNNLNLFIETMLHSESEIYEIVKTFPRTIDPDPLASEKFGYHPSHQSSSQDHTSTFELSIHMPGIAFKKELPTVFPQLLNINKNCLLIVPTFQKCRYDLTRTSMESNWERNLLLAYFLQFGKEFTAACYKHGCLWADFTDPMDGLPVCGQRGSSIYPDVEGIVRLLKYPMIQVGACSVIHHPRWQTNCYPGTLFVVGSVQTVKKALAEIGTLK